MEYKGDAVLWDYGSFSGKVNIINSDETRCSVLLELPPGIQYEGNSIYPNSIRTVLKIYDRIEEYLRRNCGEPFSEHLGRRCFSMKKIP